MSEGVTRRRVKWFWAWEAREEQEWLERQAREGWHLASGGLVFRFIKGAPGEWRYRVDYCSESGSSLRDYLALCQEAGWEHVCRFGNWRYFRTADASAPELHSDPASLAARYKRLLALIAAVMMLNLMLLATGRQPPGRSDTLWQVFQGVRLALIALLGYALVRIGTYIRQLSSEARRHLL